MRQWQKGRIPNYRPTWVDLHIAGELDTQALKTQLKIAKIANTLKVAQ